MIKVTREISHARHVEKREDTNLETKEAAHYKYHHEKLYILDLSGYRMQEELLASEHDEAALLDLSEEAKESLWKNLFPDEIHTDRAEAEDGEGSGVEDDTRRLTRKLVSAKTQFEVQDVISEALGKMKDLIMAAAYGDEKAAKILRKVKKLISRGHRKIRDLAKELQMHQQQQRAEKKEQEEIARRIRAELKRAELERSRRERKYLDDRDDDDDENTPVVSGASQAATEAKIMALAQAMAAVSSATSSGGADAGFTDTGAAFAGGGGGGEAGGGEGAVAGADSVEA